MEKLSFRLLEASEIDCRIATVNEKGVSLLLYKDARVDQNILDETVGPMNWQRSHSRDNANCMVSLWDEEKKQWISKEDTGTESYTEKEKGLASDSFKRACFNWGIGRELYTAPFIWVSSEKCKIVSTGRNDFRGKPVYTCNDRFTVSKIGYDEKKNIVDLVIKCKNTVVFSMKSKPDQPEYATEEMRQTFLSECNRIGKPKSAILKAIGGTTLAEMTIEQFKKAMAAFEKTPSKSTGGVDPSTVPPENEEGVPFK